MRAIILEELIYIKRKSSVLSSGVDFNYVLIWDKLIWTAGSMRDGLARQFTSDYLSAFWPNVSVNNET